MNQVDDTIDTIIDSFDRRSMDVRNLTIDEMFDDQSIELSKRYIEIYDLYRKHYKKPSFDGKEIDLVLGDSNGKNQKGILIYSGNNMQPNEARPTGWTVYEFNNM